MQHGFSGKKIVVGVTGSIAAFKVAGWVSSLAKEEARVSVIMTQSATEFITPLTFTALSGEDTHLDMFDLDKRRAMSHISLGQEADMLLIAPASAHTIAKLAQGLADDLLSTTVLAAHCPVIVCPAMNSRMYKHPATQANLKRLVAFGYTVIAPEHGSMACKDEGPGRLPEWDVVQEHLLRLLSVGDLKGERVVISAGPTREAIDPARFISNRSSGKMGFALAKTAWRRGAEVILVSGPTSLECPEGVTTLEVTTAREMHEKMLENIQDATIIVKSAAVSDFRPEVSHSEKIKKSQAESAIHLSQNPDILSEIGNRHKREGQFLVGFAAESENLLAEGARKLQTKNLDMIAVNDIKSSQTGFESDTNQITLLGLGEPVRLPYTSKEKCADLMWDHILEAINRKRMD